MQMLTYFYSSAEIVIIARRTEFVREFVYDNPPINGNSSANVTDVSQYLCFQLRIILILRGRAPFGQHQESRPLAGSNTDSPRLPDFPSLCACSESSLTNLISSDIGSSLILLCLQSQSESEPHWTFPEVVILGADQKERCLWGRE